MAVNVPGLIAVIVFYIIILAIGIYAGRKTSKASTSEELFVADRSIGLVVSFFTLTATMVGGGYINGTAESMAFSGLVWTQAPVGYCLALIIGALFYAKKMRYEGYITMFDPFQIKYGRKIGGLLFVPQLLGDVFWGAAILSALGATLSIILDIHNTLAIIISSVVAIVYTFFGGLYAVAYTDVIQLIFIAVGLFLAFPFSMTHESVDFSSIGESWIGHVPPDKIGVYIDVGLLLLLGGIPWQVYYQRVLACKTASRARTASIVGAFGSLLFALPPCAIGVVGKSTDWNMTDYPGEIPIPENRQSFILPLVLEYLCPRPVAILGMGAIAAAAMSSADSCILSAGTVFTQNIYKNILRRKATEREMKWILRISIVVVGALSTFIGTVATSVYGLYVMCSDLMFVVMFPQLTCVLWMRKSNGYGCVAAYFVSIVLRLCAGEPLIKLPALIHFPYYSEEHGQLFPYRTFIMLLCFLVLVFVSLLTDTMFRSGIISTDWDVLGAIARSTRRNIERDGSILQNEKHEKEIVDRVTVF